MPPSEQPRVFISYARKDGTTLAQRLQKDLKEQGFDTWVDTQRIVGGRVWSTEIDDAIKSCGVMMESRNRPHVFGWKADKPHAG
jgi:predicted esterase